MPLPQATRLVAELAADSAKPRAKQRSTRTARRLACGLLQVRPGWKFAPPKRTTTFSSWHGCEPAIVTPNQAVGLPELAPLPLVSPATLSSANSVNTTGS